MAREVEVKFRLGNAAALRQRLMELGARREAVVEESNLILDTADRTLLRRGCGLRIRVAQSKEKPNCCRVTLTYKGPRVPDAHGPGVKTREELETEVAEEAPLIDLFHRLGFAAVIRYEKRREVWHLPDAEVALDELPQLGWFVEIEAGDSQRVEAVREQLGLVPADAVSETYVELAARLGQSAEDGVSQLCFPSSAPSAAAPPA